MEEALAFVSVPEAGFVERLLPTLGPAVGTEGNTDTVLQLPRITLQVEALAGAASRLWPSGHRKREDADKTRDEAQNRRDVAEKRRLAETGSKRNTTHCETLGLVRTLTQTRSHCSCEVYATRVGIRHLDEILSDGENTLHRSG